MFDIYKKLKEVGFPFRSVNELTCGDVIHFGESVVYEEPTLSKLINACEEEEDTCRYKIVRLDIQKEITYAECWRIDKDDRYAHNDVIFLGGRREPHKGLVVAMGNGKTPKEAVAKLYIELNPNGK